MLQRLTDELCGDWPRAQLLEMDLRFCEALEKAFEHRLESRAAARSSFRVPKGRNGSVKEGQNGMGLLAEEAAIQTAWDWHIRNRDAEVPFSEIVTRVQACCVGITSARIRAGFERRRRSCA
jgi:hypothetical protein